MAGFQQPGPYRITTFKDFVPQRLRFVLLLFFAFAFQFSGGVYLACVSQVVGDKSFLQEDVMMAAYASFIGLTVTFPLAFRIKFRFKSRDILMGVAAGIAICNVITMYTGNIVLLMAASFLAGSFKLIGTFECMSNLQLKITPTRNQTVFFCALFTIILSAIQLSGLATVYLDYYFAWQYIHVIVVGGMLLVMLCALFLMKDLRMMKKLPLYGIDWLGLILWIVFLISGCFTLQYGKHLDWFDSPYIRIGAVSCFISFLLIMIRMKTAKRPYFNPEIFKYKNMKSGLLLLFVMVLMLAVPNTVQGVLTGSILHYDSLNTISLNWLVLLGVVMGTAFAWYLMVVMKLAHKWVLFVGFLCLVMYLAIMYFIIDPRVSIEMLYAPSVFRGMGYAILYVALTVYPTENIPFKYFLQPIGVLGLVRTGIGTVAASAIIANWLTYLIKKNTMLLGWELDIVNQQVSPIPGGVLYGEVIRQSMLVSVKEMLGWFVIGGFLVLLFVLTMKYIRPIVRILPKMRTYRRYLRIKFRLWSAPTFVTPHLDPSGHDPEECNS